MKLNNSHYGLAWQLCAAFVAFTSPIQVVTGSIQQEIEFDTDSYYLVSAAQSFSDLTISLVDVDQEELVRTISFPWHKGLQEYMLIQPSDCVRCRVIIAGQGKADQTRVLEYSIKKLDSTFDIDFFKFIDLAGKSVYESRTASESSRVVLLEQAGSSLIQAIEVTPLTRQRLHAMTLLAENYYYLDDKNNQKQILQKILAMTNGTKYQKFRIQALYETAAFVEDFEAEQALYDEGMKLSKLLKIDRLYAIGANYKAVGLIRNGEFETAIALLEKANTTFETEHHWRDLMYSLHNLSWAHQRAGDFPTSLKYATTQRLNAERFELAHHQVLGLYNFAMTYGQLGQLKEAEQFLTQAIFAYNKLPMHSNLSTVMGGYLMEERARRLLQLGAYSSAADIANKSSDRFKQTGYPGRMADAIFLEGEIAMARNDLSLARKKYEEVIQYDRDNNRDRALGVHSLRLAELEMNSDQLIVASALQVESLQLLSETGDYRALAAALGQTCELLYLMGAVEDANDLLKYAQIYTNKFGLEFDKAKLHYRIALIKNKLGDLQEALKQSNVAIKLIDKSLESIEQLDMRRYFFALHRSVLELNIELLVKTEPENTDRSLALAETMRARTLKERLNSGTREDADTEQYSIERDQLLEQIRLAAEEWHGSDHGDSKQQLLKTTRELGIKLERLEVNYRRFNIRPLTLADARSSTNRAIESDQLYAFYLVGKTQSWLWAIYQNGIDLYELPPQADLAKLVANYNIAIAAAPSVRNNQDAWAQRDAIEALSSVLLHPMEHIINTRNISRVTIVPDGLLHTVSFTPLTLKSGGLSLIKQFSVNIDAALGLEYSTSKPFRKPPELKNILMVSNSEPNNALATGALPSSLREADTVSRIFGTDATILSGGLATKNNFLSQGIQDFDILHFATHGLINPEEPLLSALTFSDGVKGPLWLVPEIRGASLDGKLVVMSACQTAVGKVIADEGVLSLTRAFIEAGASYIIGSLWSIQDEPSALLMQHFYHALINKAYRPDEALRYAQVNMMTLYKGRWNDPYYWAGFQLHSSL